VVQGIYTGESKLNGQQNPRFMGSPNWEMLEILGEWRLKQTVSLDIN
jgi:hypothetical protein